MSTKYVFNALSGSFDLVDQITLAAVGSSPNANGADASSNVLTLQPANTSFPGVLLAADWNTFNNKQPAGNYLTALTGDGSAAGPGSAALTLATVNSNVGSFGSASSVATFTVNAKGLTTAASSTAIQIAESQVTNLVSDLAGKQPTGNYLTALTGDGTASGPGSAALTLATVNSNVGSFGSASAVATFTVNAKGLTTAAGSTSIQIAESQVTNLVSDLAGKQATGNYITALTGDVTAAGPGSVAATIGTNKVLDTMIRQSAALSLIGRSANSTGNVADIAAGSDNQVLRRSGTAIGFGSLDLSQSNTVGVSVLALANGGTGQATKAPAFDALSPMTTIGDLIYGGTSGTGTRLPNGVTGQYLGANTGGAPSWSIPPASTLYTIASKTANYTVTNADYLLFGDSSGGAFTFTLPTAVGDSGRVFYFYKTDTSANLITIDGAGTETINGDITIAMGTKGDYLAIISDGANWKIINFGIYVAAQYYASANLAVGANAVFKFNTKLLDTHAAYATGTGLFTVPLGCTGLYRISGMALATGAAAALYLSNNGSAGAYVCSANTSNVGGGSQTVFLTSGQTLGLASDTATTLVGSSAPYKTCFSIERLN